MQLASNYWIVILGGVLAMAFGMIWYGPFLGKKWMEIIGVSTEDLESKKSMHSNVGKLYFIQFLLVLLQVFVLRHFLGGSDSEILQKSIWIWLAFVMPTLAGTVMWTPENSRIKWARFLIQSGYQLFCFVIFGLVFAYFR